MHNNLKKTLDKGKSEFASETEQKEMQSLFHQSVNEYELKGLLLDELESTAVKETSSIFPKELFTKLWAKIEKGNHKSKSRVRPMKTISTIAAAVVIGLIIGIYVSSIKRFQKPEYYAASSPKGSIAKMMLPDSSMIALNAGSEIKYSYHGDRGIREVFLTGEAWFDVHKNKKKPFIVHTSCFDIHVTGTQFNVKCYEADNLVTTTLEEGQVIITGSENYKLAESVELVPGEQVVLNRDTKEVTIKKVNTEWFTSWKDHKLIIVNMRLEDLVVLLERKYGVDIEVNNDEILDLHIYYIIENETIIEVLEIIKIRLPIDYKIIDQKIIITAN